MQHPDFRTINDFRKRHFTALSGLFVQVLKPCQAAGPVSLGHVALGADPRAVTRGEHLGYGKGDPAGAARATAAMLIWT